MLEAWKGASSSLHGKSSFLKKALNKKKKKTRGIGGYSQRGESTQPQPIAQNPLYRENFKI